jgi:lipid A 3-O-deacylase
MASDSVKFFVITFFLLLYCHCSYANDSLISVGGGIHSIYKEKYRTGEVRLEYKFPQEFKHFRPLIGGMVTFDKAYYLYGGIGLELIVVKRILISPSFAAGYYNKGNGRDLGFPLEFRSGMELGYCFSSQYRIGLQFYHMSNASLGKRNPGSESLVLALYFPIRKTSTKKQHRQ